MRFEFTICDCINICGVCVRGVEKTLRVFVARVSFKECNTNVIRPTKSYIANNTRPHTTHLQVSFDCIE